MKQEYRELFPGRDDLAERFFKSLDAFARTDIIFSSFNGEKYGVEYVRIPAVTPEGASKPLIINYPGGGTHLAHCVEPFLWADRESVTISPLGYGRSADPPRELFRHEPVDFCAEILASVVKKIASARPCELYGHSNAAPVVARAARMLCAEGCGVQALWLVNPLGLRAVPRVVQALCFTVSGMCTRLTRGAVSRAMGARIMEVYTLGELPKHPSYMREELTKATDNELFWSLRRVGASAGVKGRFVRVICSDHDWAQWHVPGARTNHDILCDALDNKYVCYRIAGLHNITMGTHAREVGHILSHG